MTPSTRFSMPSLAAYENEFGGGEDRVELGALSAVPQRASPFRMAFWRRVALEHLAKLLLKLSDPWTMSARGDEHLQQDARGSVRRLGHGWHQVVLHHQFLEFRSDGHGALSFRVRNIPGDAVAPP